jgi:hypothetical protein
MGLFPVLIGLCFPRFEPSDAGIVATAVEKKFGKDATLCYWGGHPSLSLCFALRKEIRQILTPEDLKSALLANPNLIVITQSRLKSSPTTEPVDSFESVYRVTTLTQRYDFYMAKDREN